MQGRLKFYLADQRFGFVELVDETGELVFAEYFFHRNDVIGDLPAKGDLVNFFIEDPPSRARRRELIAVEVEKIPASDTVALEVFEERLEEEARIAC